MKAMKKNYSVFLGAMLCFSLVSFAQPGSLDGDFDADGKVITDIAGGYEYGFTVAIQQDGKIVVAGESDNQIIVARYHPDGTMDNTFGLDGIVSTAITIFSWATGVVIQPDGKILIAGNTDFYDICVVRYNIDGSLDASFGTGGILTNNIGDQTYGSSIVLQTDGKILVAGYVETGGDYNFLVLRYNPSGSLDNTFSFDGIVNTDFNSRRDAASSIQVQIDGKIVVAGYTADPNNADDSDFALTRYNADGSLDISFGTNGKVTTNYLAATYLWPESKDVAHSMALQPDGKIVVAGYLRGGLAPYFHNFAVVRYNTDGTLDTSFAGSGKAFVNVSQNDNTAYSVALQADDKIVLAGRTWNGSDYDFAIVRLNTDASLDSIFGTNGKVITDIAIDQDECYSVVVQPDGRILAAGYATVSGTNRDIALARYLSGLNIGIVEFSEQNNAVLIYPNPIRDNAQLEFELLNDDFIDILLYNMQGVLVQEIKQNINLPKGQHSIALNFNNSLAAGNYLLVISGVAGKQEIRIVKE